MKLISQRLRDMAMRYDYEDRPLLIQAAVALERHTLNAIERECAASETPVTRADINCTCYGNAPQCEWEHCRVAKVCQYPSYPSVPSAGEFSPEKKAYLDGIDAAADYCEKTLAGNHPSLAHAYRHAAINIRAFAGTRMGDAATVDGMKALESSAPSSEGVASAPTADESRDAFIARGYWPNEVLWKVWEQACEWRGAWRPRS